MTAQDFYRGKTITWIVSSEPGGGTDINTRIVAPYLAKETGAAVKVEDMGSDEGVNYVYNQAKRDGLTLVINSLGAIIGNDILKAPGAIYETDKLSFLGDIYPSGNKVLQTSPKASYKTLEALRQAKGLKAGATSAKGTFATTTAVTFELLGLDGKVVTGFKGGAGLRLALTQGEVDFIAFSDDTAQKEEADGSAVNVLILGNEKSLTVPNVPTISELGVKIPKELEAAHQFIISAGYAAALPPEVPQDRIEYLREVFQKLGSNIEVQKELQNANQGPQRPFMSGKALQEKIATIKANKGLAEQLDAIFAKYMAVQ